MVTKRSLFERHPELYDAMVPWPNRLAREIPFLKKQLEAVEAHRILDAGCGPGRHIIELAQEGYEVIGLDISTPMVKIAKENAKQSGVSATFKSADLLNLHQAIKKNVDAVFVLGNTLSSLPDPSSVSVFFQRAASVLNPGGILVVQVLNHDRWKPQGIFDYPPRQFTWQDYTGYLLRHFEWLTNKVEMTTALMYQKDGEWSQEFNRHYQLALNTKLLEAMLKTAGYSSVKFMGGMDASKFNPKTSNDLVLIAQK